jgi:hypothetical protein
MGFEGGVNGVKRFICDNRILLDATHRNYTVKAALTEMRVPYDSTALILDGNCKAMAVRKNSKTLDEYVTDMLSAARRAMAAGRIVVMCFDVPTLVPPTKGETQAKRDARATGAGPGGLPGYPTDATFDVATLEALPDCHPLIENREMRYRLFDEVFSRVLVHVRQDAARTRASGREEGVLVVDGIDLRGAGRNPDMPRRPGVHGTNVEAVAAVASAPRTEGEADVHMLTVEARLREATELGQMYVSAIVHETVDTDHFAITLRHHANRVNRKMDQHEVIRTYLVMNEASNCKYAVQQLASLMQVAEGVAGVLIIDVETLYIQVMTLLAGASWRERIPEPAARVALVQRLVAVWALGGCDFVDRIGHADVLTRAFVECVRWSQTSERWSHGLKPWFTSADAKLALPMFRHVVQVATSDPGAARMRARLLGGGDASYLRAAWTSAYWGGVEQPVFGAVRTKVLTDAYGDDPPDAPLPTMGRPYDYSQWGFSGVADGSLVVETPKRTRDDETPDSVDDEEGGAESDHDMEEAYNSEGDDNILVMDGAGCPTTVS